MHNPSWCGLTAHRVGLRPWLRDHSSYSGEDAAYPSFEEFSSWPDRSEATIWFVHLRSPHIMSCVAPWDWWHNPCEFAVAIYTRVSSREYRTFVHISIARQQLSIQHVVQTLPEVNFTRSQYWGCFGWQTPQKRRLSEGCLQDVVAWNGDGSLCWRHRIRRHRLWQEPEFGGDYIGK